MTLQDWLNIRYSMDSLHSIPKEIMGLWSRFEPYADSDFISELCSDKTDKFQQRYWEMSLCCWLLDRGMRLLPSKGKGPDITIQTDTNKIFIEAISPTPGDGGNRIPNLVQDLKDGRSHGVYSVPHTEILLRWTAAFKEKANKFQQYIDEGLITEGDVCVIAINSCQLGPFGFDGISGYPAILSAVYPIGPMRIRFPADNPSQVTKDNEYRPFVKNANQSEVSTTPFLDNQYSRISAVLATHRNEYWKYQVPISPLVLVHNLLANPVLPPKCLPVDHECWTERTHMGIEFHIDPPLNQR